MHEWAAQHIQAAHGGDDRGWGDFDLVELEGSVINPHVMCCLRCGPAGTVHSAQCEVTDYDAA